MDRQPMASPLPTLVGWPDAMALIAVFMLPELAHEIMDHKPTG